MKSALSSYRIISAVVVVAAIAAAAPPKNYYRAAKLFCDMNDLTLNWKRILGALFKEPNPHAALGLTPNYRLTIFDLK